MKTKLDILRLNFYKLEGDILPTKLSDRVIVVHKCGLRKDTILAEVLRKIKNGTECRGCKKKKTVDSFFEYLDSQTDWEMLDRDTFTYKNMREYEYFKHLDCDIVYKKRLVNFKIGHGCKKFLNLFELF